MKDNIIIMDHPLLKHKISLLRDKKTGTNEFRALVNEISMLMGYEALRDLPTEDVQIYVGQLDRELNKDAYICPGLGDAGDRIFGTK